jgi:hypothetical protein
MSALLYTIGGLAILAAFVLAWVYAVREDGSRYLGISWQAWLITGLVLGGLSLICMGNYV